MQKMKMVKAGLLGCWAVAFYLHAEWIVHGLWVEWNSIWAAIYLIALIVLCYELAK